MNSRDRIDGDKGVIASMVALSLLVFMGFAALVIDLGFGLVTRNQLHNIADGAALAGTRQLGKIYEGLIDWGPQGYELTDSDKSSIFAKVREIGEKNVAGGKVIDINTNDIVIGQWDSQNKNLTPTDLTPDAVKVRARRDDQANTPLTTFFAWALGTNSLKVIAQATAALTGIHKVTEHEIGAPIGVARVWFDNQVSFCEQSIYLSPKNDIESCAGWHTFLQEANASNLRDIIVGLRLDTFTSPDATAGVTQFNFIGGDVSFAYTEFQKLYDAKSVCSTTKVPCSDAPCAETCEWSTLVAVYNSPTCANPTSAITIDGFAMAKIIEVSGPPDRLVTARIGCDAVWPNTRGGGANFGTKGSIPGLVQ